MTQAPIETRHKDMAAKAAGLTYPLINCTYAAISSILAHAQTLANLEKARADLAEIDCTAVAEGWSSGSFYSEINKVAAIAAPYRASDPVAEAARELFDTIKYIGAPSDISSALEAFTAKFREIAPRAFIEGDR